MIAFKTLMSIFFTPGSRLIRKLFCSTCRPDFLVRPGYLLRGQSIRIHTAIISRRTQCMRCVTHSLCVRSDRFFKLTGEREQRSANETRRLPSPLAFIVRPRRDGLAARAHSSLELSDPTSGAHQERGGGGGVVRVGWRWYLTVLIRGFRHSNPLPG